MLKNGHFFKVYIQRHEVWIKHLAVSYECTYEGVKLLSTLSVRSGKPKFLAMECVKYTQSKCVTLPIKQALILLMERLKIQTFEVYLKPIRKNKIYTGEKSLAFHLIDALTYFWCSHPSRKRCWNPLLPLTITLSHVTNRSDSVIPKWCTSFIEAGLSKLARKLPFCKLDPGL